MKFTCRVCDYENKQSPLTDEDIICERCGADYEPDNRYWDHQDDENFDVSHIIGGLQIED